MKNIIWISACSIFLWSCSDQAKPEFDSCEAHAEYVFAKETAFVESDFNPELSSELMREYAAFANSCSNDSLAPEFLMRRADMLRGKGKTIEAISAFTAIHDGYPHYPNKVNCALISAFLYDTVLNDKEMAEKIYQEVVNLYPDTEEAKKAKVALKYLRETPEELFRRLNLDANK